MSAERIKTALIGTGRWGTNIARELASASDFLFIASRSGKASDVIQALVPDVQTVSVETIAADAHVSAVVVATPINTHADISGILLRANKHVLVEKPAAETSREAHTLAQEALSRNLIYVTGYIFLYHPVYRELKTRLRQKESSILSIECIWNKYGTFTETIEQNLLTHHFSIALDLFGNPQGATWERGEGVESQCDRLVTTLTYPSHTFISRIDRASSHKEHSLNVCFTDGSALRWEGNNLSGRSEENKPWEIIFSDSRTPLEIELQEFLLATQTGIAPVTGGDFGAHVLEIHEMLSK